MAPRNEVVHAVAEEGSISGGSSHPDPQLTTNDDSKREGAATDAATATQTDEQRAYANAATSLRVCCYCYGSSSARTPEKYTNAAYNLGLSLAQGGHVCVNGAGSSGCMAAMNRGASAGKGRIVGVIHEKFVVDGSDWLDGEHSVFREEQNEVLIARGNDLQERKRLLVKDADALIVLPGGPGTWDELWEMACARHIGFHAIPIVCINVDGFYDSFKTILKRAHEDDLLYKQDVAKDHHKKPSEIIHFEETPEAAVQWVEEYLANQENKKPKNVLKKRDRAVVNRLQSCLHLSSSFLSASSFLSVESANESPSDLGTSTKESSRRSVTCVHCIAAFSAGVIFCLAATQSRK